MLQGARIRLPSCVFTARPQSEAVASTPSLIALALHSIFAVPCGFVIADPPNAKHGYRLLLLAFTSNTTIGHSIFRRTYSVCEPRRDAQRTPPFLGAYKATPCCLSGGLTTILSCSTIGSTSLIASLWDSPLRSRTTTFNHTVQGSEARLHTTLLRPAWSDCRIHPITCLVTTTTLSPSGEAKTLECVSSIAAGKRGLTDCFLCRDGLLATRVRVKATITFYATS